MTYGSVSLKSFPLCLPDLQDTYKITTTTLKTPLLDSMNYVNSGAFCRPREREIERQRDEKSKVELFIQLLFVVAVVVGRLVVWLLLQDLDSLVWLVNCGFSLFSSLFLSLSLSFDMIIFPCSEASKAAKLEENSYQIKPRMTPERFPPLSRRATQK